ncbi:MAG: hypothetical protein E7643_08485 [Ruminococcaceae bacterium]|nr:hypothetical protein [Oscillospiraceae bacterium]
MGYNKENYKRIREAYGTKAFRAREEADLRRAEIYRVIPEVKALDNRLSEFGLCIMKTALDGGSEAGGIEQLKVENARLRDERRALLLKNGYPEDYTSPRYECEKCRDTGYCDIKMCECMRRALVEAGMESSGLAALMKKQSFENFSLDYYRGSPNEYRSMSENYRYLFHYAESFAIKEDAPAPQSILMLGGTGLGKTHLSTAIARKVLERGYDVYYNSAVGMISDFEYRRFGNGLASDVTDDTARYIDCDLLIIDDLGTEVVNQFTLSCLYYVVNTRLNLQKPMIINTNLSPAELRKNYSDRISSRLMGEFVLTPFYGTDIRKQKIQNG